MRHMTEVDQACFQPYITKKRRASSIAQPKFALESKRSIETCEKADGAGVK